MASAYHPAFKQAPLGGKSYADGGFYDLVPISALVSMVGIAPRKKPRR